MNAPVGLFRRLAQTLEDVLARRAVREELQGGGTHDGMSNNKGHIFNDTL